MCTWLEPRTWDMWWSKWLLFILLRLKAWLLNQVYQKQRTQNTYRKSWHTAPPSLHFEVLRMRHELRRQTAEGHSASEQTVCSWPKSWPQAILTGTISVIACYSHVACAQSTKPCSRWNEGSSCCKPENCRQPHYHHYLASIPFHSIPFQQSHSDLSSSFKFYRDLWWSLCQQWGLTLEPPQHSPKPEVDLISSTLERLSHGKTYFRGNCDSFLFSKKIKKHTLWLFNIAMENGPFIDDFPSYKPPFIGDSPWLCES